MKECPHYEPLIAGLLFDDLSGEERERLEAHLVECEGCRRAVREMDATLQLTAARPRPEPAPAFWDGYYDRLAARLAREEAPRSLRQRFDAWWARAVRPRLEALQLSPRRAYRLAAAVALVAAGVFIGWLVFGTSGVDVADVAEAPEEHLAPEVPVQRAALEVRTDRYLERSKVLLLGLVNLEPTQQAATAHHLSRKQAVARELVAEADTLKEALDAADQRALRALIDDLEVILLQIANLEASNDLAAVEMVRRGVDSRALLLKIDLTSLRRAEAARPPETRPTF